MVMQLAIVEIDGKRYFDDERLREYRNIDDHTDSIRYGEIGNRAVKVIQERTDIRKHPEKLYKPKFDHSLRGRKLPRKPKL